MKASLETHTVVDYATTMNIQDALSSTAVINQKAVGHFVDIYAKKDNWHQIDKASGNLGYGWIHYSLIRILRPDRVLCIGSRYGYIPAICALACRDNKKGHVDFVDANYNQYKPEQKNHWGGVGYWTTPEGKQSFERFRLNKHISVHIMTSGKYKTSVPQKTWGYIHIDGDHSYRGIKKDFQLFWPSVRKNGYLVLHDIFTKDLGGLDYGVKKFWQELRHSKKYNCIEIPGMLGIGIIQRI